MPRLDAFQSGAFALFCALAIEGQSAAHYAHTHKINRTKIEPRLQAICDRLAEFYRGARPLAFKD